MSSNYDTNVQSYYEIICTGVNEIMDFAERLNAEMRQQKVSGAELSRASGVSETMISKLLDRSRQPSARTCVKLARALNLEPDKMLQAAGFLPPKRSEYSPEIIELVEMYEVLPKEARDHVRELIRTFYVRNRN